LNTAFSSRKRYWLFVVFNVAQPALLSLPNPPYDRRSADVVSLGNIRQTHAPQAVFNEACVVNIERLTTDRQTH
jgi:hypothetical protein